MSFLNILTFIYNITCERPKGTYLVAFGLCGCCFWHPLCRMITHLASITCGFLGNFRIYCFESLLWQQLLLIYRLSLACINIYLAKPSCAYSDQCRSDCTYQDGGNLLSQMPLCAKHPRKLCRLYSLLHHRKLPPRELCRQTPLMRL